MNEAAFRTNARELRRLHQNIRAANHEFGHGSAEHRAAIATYHERYDGLAFPGGYERARAELRAKNPDIVELALTFLEIRPYFNQSQYMAKTIKRLIRAANLSPAQQARLDAVVASAAERKIAKRLVAQELCDQCGHAQFRHDGRRGCRDCGQLDKRCKIVYHTKTGWEPGA